MRDIKATKASFIFTLCALTFIAILSLAGGSVSARGPLCQKADKQKDIETIREASTRFSAAYMRGDIDEMLSIYTDDAVIFPNGRNMMRGRDELRSYWTLRPGRKITYHKATPVEISIEGDTAYDYGNYEVRGTQEGVAWEPAFGKYVIVWKRTGGSWKMYLDIWNGNPAPKK
ncbi:MAG: DUF4440 domain-containing protein [Blastocatellia bacterium]|nr:DUF4440 domain-containing protein [Blastocatellia bacterium]